MRNQRRLGRPINIEEEASLWHGAIERKLDGCFLQIVGLGSPTSTAFTRILINERSSLGSSTSRDVAQPPLPQFTLNHVVDVVLEAARLDHEVPLNGGDLIRLGSVWLLPNSTCDWIARRLSAADINAVPEDWLCVTLRIHYNPPRFPSSWRVSDAIVHEDREFGFTILNKPGGVPSHATVDNGCENALSMFQATIENSTQSESHEKMVAYATLPHRLDTETSGVLLISRSKDFTSFVSRLLQQKTLGHTRQTSIGTGIANAFGITKKYRCLVCINDVGQWDELWTLKSTRKVVTHYMDAQSPAPKSFVSEEPLDADSNGSGNNWLECQLSILDVSKAVPVSSTLEKCLWRSDLNNRKPSLCSFLAELEVELYTGRTHQIRGQLAAMGFPIVGDPLYGGGGDICASRARGSDSMALQCCSIQFPHPEWAEKQRKSGKYYRWLVPSTRNFAVRLDQAWWTHCLDRGHPSRYGGC